MADGWEKGRVTGQKWQVGSGAVEGGLTRALEEGEEVR